MDKFRRDTMQLENRIQERLDLQHSLSLNANVLQSLEVLRLPIQELRELLISKSYDNPLLELGEPIRQDEGAPKAKENAAESIMTDDPDDRAEIKAVYSDIRAAGTSGGDAFLALASRGQTFGEMVEEQLGALKLDAQTAALSRYIVASLDRRGYFSEDPAEIARLLGCEPSAFLRALAVVQGLEPAGVGARNLKECLLLQLTREDRQSVCAGCEKLVKEGLELLAANNVKAIASLLNVDEAGALELCRRVRALNPIPSQGYDTGEGRQTVIPDATVEKVAEGFRVVYNQRWLPTVKLNEEYVRMIPLVEEGEAKDYLRRNLTEARQLMKAVERREGTLTRIIGQIVRRQPRFFEDGVTLVPMTLEAIASELELNISTVSRAIQGKYIQCACGTIEIKKLFTTGLKGRTGEMVSTAMIKRKIGELIGGEPSKKPLSDEKICRILQAGHADISRRTVAKYREELGIPSSSKRRQRQA